jgi:hypothetical protein
MHSLLVAPIIELRSRSFCVDCILSWSKIANTCPLCQQRFGSVTHLLLDLSQLPARYTQQVGPKIPGNILQMHVVFQKSQVEAHQAGINHYPDKIVDLLTHVQWPSGSAMPPL